MGTNAKMQAEVDFLFQNPETYIALPKRREATLRLWCDETFGPRIVWSLHPDLGSTPKGKVGYVLRRIVAHESGATPSQLYGAEARPDHKRLEGIFGRMHQLVVTPFTEREEALGRDGKVWGIAYGDALNSIELRWWLKPPAGWQPIAQWFDETTAYFESILPAHFE